MALTQKRLRLPLRLHHLPGAVTATIQAEAGRAQMLNNHRAESNLKPHPITLKLRVNPGGVRLLNNRWSDLNTKQVNLPSEKNLLVPKELSEKDIRKYLDDLNSRLGNSRKGTSGGQARLILLGKASVKIMGLETKENPQKVYHIDVMLEGGQRGEQVRQCVESMRVFREFDKQEQDTTKACETFFGTTAHRAVVLNDVFRGRKCVSNKKHLEVYVMDTKRALEFELRRWADPDSDDSIQHASVNIAVALLGGLIKQGLKLQGRSSFQEMRYIKDNDGIHDKAINDVKKRFDAVFPNEAAGIYKDNEDD
ncbi:hypothetical protein INS49_007027 [Diaporthe citri]|uniref:uncharacterized protein n=1 Tax=Diaporthe citri TaxID=83186 RepID=UPI001C7F3C9C|nr:uncharacterized protein INS49_007027 [Diaporthe citri]KAG6365416.1 hypothetical protein INS49_007027 [Diaporthe citri]